MSRLAMIDAKGFAKILQKLEYERVRQTGSHVIYEHSDGKSVSVPHHKGEDLPRPLLRSLLRKIDISIDEYDNLR